MGEGGEESQRNPFPRKPRSFSTKALGRIVMVGGTHSLSRVEDHVSLCKVHTSAWVEGMARSVSLHGYFEFMNPHMASFGLIVRGGCRRDQAHAMSRELVLKVNFPTKLSTQIGFPTKNTVVMQHDRRTELICVPAACCVGNLVSYLVNLNFDLVHWV